MKKLWKGILILIIMIMFNITGMLLTTLYLGEESPEIIEYIKLVLNGAVLLAVISTIILVFCYKVSGWLSDKSRSLEIKEIAEELKRNREGN